MSNGEGFAEVTKGLKLGIFAGGETTINAGSKYESVVGSKNDFVLGISNDTVVGARNDVTIGYRSDLSLGGTFSYDADGPSLDINKNKSILAAKGFTVKAGMDTASQLRYKTGDKAAKVLLYSQAIGNGVTTALAGIPQFFVNTGDIGKINATQEWGQNSAIWTTNLFDVIVPIVSWQYMNIEETTVPRSVLSMDDNKGVFIGTALDTLVPQVPDATAGAGAYFTKDGAIKITSFKAPQTAVTHLQMFNANYEDFQTPPAGSERTFLNLTPGTASLKTDKFAVNADTRVTIWPKLDFRVEAGEPGASELTLGVQGFQVTSGKASIYARKSVPNVAVATAAATTYEASLVANRLANSAPPDAPKVPESEIVGLKSGATTLAEVSDGEINLTTGVSTIKLTKTSIELDGAGIKISVGATGVDIGGALKVLAIPVPMINEELVKSTATDVAKKAYDTIQTLQEEIAMLKGEIQYDVKQDIIKIKNKLAI